jgi:hypothetical protein
MDDYLDLYGRYCTSCRNHFVSTEAETECDDCQRDDDE